MAAQNARNKSPRGRCWECWQTQALTAAGNVWRHKAAFYSPSAPPRYVACPGAGRAPMVMVSRG